MSLLDRCISGTLNYEGAFIKAEGSKTKKGLPWKKQQGSLSGAVLALWKCYRKEISLGRAALAH